MKLSLTAVLFSLMCLTPDVHASDSLDDAIYKQSCLLKSTHAPARSKTSRY